MADTDTNLDGGLQVANPDNSTAQGQGNSFDPVAFEQRITEKILSAIKSDPRTTQSMKDRVIADVKKDKGFREYVAQYEEMKAQGMSRREIETAIELDEIKSRLAAPQPVQPGTPNTVGVQVTELAEALGLDLRDPVVAQIAVGDDAMRGLIAHAKQKKTSNPAAALAQSPSAPTPPNMDALAREYKVKALSARGNRNAIRQIQAEYAQKGVDVSRIDLMAP